MNLVLNIGLNNNPKEVEYIVELLKVWFGADKFENKTVNSVYNDNTEPTLVVKVNTTTDINLSVSLIEDLCKLTTQECIAMVHSDYKLLVYNPNFKGEIMDFSEEYFVQ